jgi:hypothetical protein
MTLSTDRSRYGRTRVTSARPTLLVALVSLIGALVFAGTGVATASDAYGPNGAPYILTLTDVKGDANAINGQSLVDGLGNHGGLPVYKANADILSITLASTGMKTEFKGETVFTCTGFTATMKLSAPLHEWDESNTSPDAGAHYRVAGVGVANTAAFWLRYQTDSSGTHSWLSYSDGTHAGGRSLRTAVKLDGNTIVFTVTESDLKAVGEKLSSFTWRAIGADTRTSTVLPRPTPLATPWSLAAPAWDNVDQDPANSFTPCA